ncbi:hypothetical protein [Aurantibacillus circumpalustris]|uniref:hypothetical protein n=1 Tax=Aurantibacillus circumpalustris TaxID=3036359 RepID=UPI00295AA91D|nr:hypothetical protein [Aurantibacillus circumpalustris]
MINHTLIKRVVFFSGCLLLLSLFYCCGSDERSGSKGEGLIEFDTKGVDPTHPLYGFAPSSATFKFKEDKFIIEMSTMGMFNTSVILDSKAKTIAQTVKFLDIKQACIENEQDLVEENADYALKIEETKETKVIIGLKAYKAHVTKISEPNVKFDVWYTKELGMENVNALTPYAQLKGILLDYRVKKMGMELHFAAKSYKDIKIPDNAFEIPASMKIVSKTEMEEFIKNLQ